MTDYFGSILYRASYLVLPRLAMEAMPHDWQKRMKLLLEEAEEAGLETPEYYVFRNLDRGNPENIRGVKDVSDDPFKAFYRFTGGWQEDPWSDYRRGDVKVLCPNFKPITVQGSD